MTDILSNLKVILNPFGLPAILFFFQEPIAEEDEVTDQGDEKVYVEKSDLEALTNAGQQLGVSNLCFICFFLHFQF